MIFNLPKISNYIHELHHFASLALQEGIKLEWDNSWNDYVLLSMSKGTHHLSKKVSRFEIEDGHLLNILKDMKLELNMTNTITEEDTAKILQIKEKIKNIHYNHVSGNISEWAIIAGGCFSSLWHMEPVKDYDVFVLEEGTTKYANEFDSYNPKVFVQSNVEYLRNPHIKKVVLDTRTKVQYIFTDYKSRKELIDQFDMLHCCVSWERKTDKLYISPAILDAIKRKVILPNGNKTIQEWRQQKMRQKGWNAPVSV